MSTPDGLNDDEAAFMDQLGPEEDVDGDTDAGRVEALEQQLAAEREARQELEAEFAEFKREIFKTVNRLQAQVDGDAVSGETELEQYATAPGELREHLSANQRRAVQLYEQWTEIAWQQHQDHGGRYYVDTASRSLKKNHPSRLKHELETRFNESLSWNDIYRTLQQVAKLSGGEECVDEHGRTHIEGGDYEYHEKPNADASKMKRVLVEVSE